VTAYGVVTLDRGTHLFVDPAKVEGCGSSLDGVIVHPYEDISDFLKHLASLGLSVQLDPTQLNWGLSSVAAAGRVIEQVSPIQLMKSIKNEVELHGIRQAHIRDGVALTAFLGWLDSAVRAGTEPVTECSLAEVLETFRKKMDHHVSPSFATIAGYGPNGTRIFSILNSF
jgi:Xaa-Pro aminopeptidase